MNIKRWLKSFTPFETVLVILIIIVTSTLAYVINLFLENSSEYHSTESFSTEKFNPLKKALINFPGPAKFEFLDIVDNADKMTFAKRDVTGQGFRFVVAVMSVKKKYPELCSAIVIRKHWAVASSSCTQIIKNGTLDDFRIAEFETVPGNMTQKREHTLKQIIHHPQYTGNSSTNDISLIETVDPFWTPKECRGRFSTPWASAMVKPADLLVAISWNMTKHTDQDYVASICANPVFLNNDGGLFEWNAQYEEEIKQRNLVGFKSSQNLGAPLLKGYAAYALISKNGKLTKLADHIKWISDQMLFDDRI